MEVRVQSIRPLVEERKVGPAAERVTDGRRRRMAQRRFHDQPRSPACRWRKRGAEINAIGRSRGGPSTKVHLIVDALGLPVAFEITEGQRNDSVSSVPLIERIKPHCLLADKAFDTNNFRNVLARAACTAVIPPMGNRARDFAYDKHLYKARSAVECTFNLLKQARRFATRYEKTLRNYTAVVTLGCALLWLRI